MYPKDLFYRGIPNAIWDNHNHLCYNPVDMHCHLASVSVKGRLLLQTHLWNKQMLHNFYNSIFYTHHDHKVILECYVIHSNGTDDAC